MDSVRIIQNRETRIKGLTHYSNAYSFDPNSDPTYMTQLEQDQKNARSQLAGLYYRLRSLKYLDKGLEKEIDSLRIAAHQTIAKGSFREDIANLLKMKFQMRLHPFRMRIHDVEMSDQKLYFPNKKQKN